MALLKKYDLAGQELDSVSLDDALLKETANSQLIKDYIVALRANMRQWSANTKTRAEVAHSGQKPHPQKGTGRARQGYLGAPQYKGGGRVHSPRPKFDQCMRRNRKEKRAAIRQLLTEKVRDARVHVLQFDAFEKPKTKLIADFLQKVNLKDRRVLFLCETEETSLAKYEHFEKSIRNIPRIKFAHFSAANGYDVVLSHDVILLEPVYKQFISFLEGAV